ELLGTFAFYCRKPELPQPDHWRLVEMATHVASIAIGSDQSRAAMRESETKLKQAQRIGKIGYWERDVIHDRISWPEETSRIFGLPSNRGPISQSQLEALIHPDDRQVQRRALEDAVQKCKPYDVEYRIIRSDGKIRSVHVRDEIVCDGSVRPVRMFGTVQDITERKQAEELLKARETEIRAIVEHSPDPIARFDRKMRRTYVNPALIRMMEAPKAKRSGRKAGPAVGNGGAKASAEEMEMERSLNKVFETGRPLDFESSWPLPEGRRKYAVHLEPEFDGHGSLSSVLFIGRDITERRRAEEALRQNGRELARIARLTMMAELTASIAHEVNQPLAAVVTNANAALRWLGLPAPNLDEARQAVERIASDGTRASEVIQRVRDLVKKSQPGKKRINLNELVEQTVLLMQPELAAKKIQVKKELAPLPALVAADPVQVQQVLLNLLANAVESLAAVPERRRTLVVTTSQAGGAAQVAVLDNGVGINARGRQRLFQPFYTTKPGGLGMGLPISRSIVEAHGGRLWATCSRGRGATFQFTLPAQDGDPL
ncbi:MAG: PAS domain-containing sensor histidine kinase, partial [Limisphaerales bacterium]